MRTPWFVACFVLFSAPLYAAADMLHVVCESDGRVLPLVAVLKGRLMVQDGDKIVPAPEAASWRLDGDIRPAADLFRWSPSYSIHRWAGPDILQPDGHPFVATTRLSHSTFIDSMGRPQSSSLLQDWPEGTQETSAAVVVWITAGNVTFVSVQPLPDTGSTNIFTRETSIPLSLADATAGAPGIALWRGGAFIPPAPLFDGPAEQDALAAVIFDDTEALARAFAAGASPVATSRDGVSLAHIAAEAGAIRTLDALIARDPEVVRLATKHKETPLHWAASKGRTEAIQHLLAAKAAKNARDDTDQTPLLGAARCGQLDAVRALLAAKATIGQEDKFHHAPLPVAIDRGFADVADLLHKSGASFAATETTGLVLLTQCRLGHTAMVGWLIEHRVRPTARRRGENALLAAAFHGDPALADLLLTHRVPVDQVSDDGVTALGVACLRGHTEFAARLLDAGASVTTTDGRGYPPLVLAAQGGSLPTVAMVLDHGADLAAKTKQGVTALGLALIMDNVAVAENLITRGARLDVSDPRIALLMEAAIRNDLDGVVARALEDGWLADSALSGWPAIRVAEIFRAARTRAMLEKAGATYDENSPCPLVLPAELDARPRATALPLPEDPRDAREAYPAASIAVDFIVNADGRALFPRIGPTPDPRLRLMIAQVVSLWRFAPVSRQGSAVATRVKFPVPIPSSEERMLNVRQVDVLPQPIARVQPTYPLSEKRRGVEARVVLRFIVTETGTVENIRVVETTGEAFSTEAIAALRRWKFKPAQLDDKAVAVEMQQPIIFSLSP